MRSLIPVLLLFFVCSLFHIHCNKDEYGPRPFVRLITHEVQDITDSGATFVAELVEGITQKITETGFIYSTDSTFNSITAHKIIVPWKQDGKTFSFRITKALLRNKIYYIKSYLISNDLTIIGNTIKFFSKGSRAAQIYSFFPQEAKCGDTLKIFGSNFSPFANENLVKFNSTLFEVLTYSDTLISAFVSSNELSGTISVEVQSSIAYASGQLKVIHPAIDLISPTSAWVGDTVNFYIRNLNPNTPIDVKIGMVYGIVVNRSSEGFQCILKDSLIKSDEQVIVSTPCNDIIYQSNFSILEPQIESAPTIITGPEEEIVLLGKGFFKEHTQVYMDLYPCRLVSITPRKMVLKIPFDFLNGLTKNKIHTRFVMHHFTSVININQSFIIDYISNWTPKQDFPGEPRKGGIAFSFNSKGYFGLGSGNQGNHFNDLWEYDPIIDSWNLISHFPGEPRTDAVCFLIKDKAYIGLGQKLHPLALSDSVVFFSDFYRFDVNTRNWKQLSSFPGTGRSSSVGIGLNDDAYLLGGENIKNHTYTVLKDQYKYNIITDHWSQLPDFIHVSRTSGINLNNKGFFIFNNTLFSLENDQWINLINVPFSSTYIHATALNNNIYFGFGLFHQGDNNFFEINLLENKIRPLSLPLSLTEEKEIDNASIITISDKCYIICGNDIRGNPTQHVWEFDPTKPR